MDTELLQAKIERLEAGGDGGPFGSRRSMRRAPSSRSPPAVATASPASAGRGASRGRASIAAAWRHRRPAQGAGRGHRARCLTRPWSRRSGRCRGQPLSRRGVRSAGAGAAAPNGLADGRRSGSSAPHWVTSRGSVKPRSGARSSRSGATGWLSRRKAHHAQAPRAAPDPPITPKACLRHDAGVLLAPGSPPVSVCSRAPPRGQARRRRQPSAQAAARPAPRSGSVAGSGITAIRTAPRASPADQRSGRVRWQPGRVRPAQAGGSSWRAHSGGNRRRGRARPGA
jgi:hypothetical protein